MQGSTTRKTPLINSLRTTFVSGTDDTLSSFCNAPSVLISFTPPPLTALVLASFILRIAAAVSAPPLSGSLRN